VFKSYYADPPESKKVKYSEAVFVGYRHYDAASTKPLFPFGCGLSYTSFGDANLSVTPSGGSLKDATTVSFDVTNTRARQGSEVAELYVAPPHSQVPRPAKELKGFAKVDLKPGEMRHMTLTLDRRAFSYYDVDKKDWVAEAGEYTILVGGSSVSLPPEGVVHPAIRRVGTEWIVEQLAFYKPV
jgi:beta-glucosidase